MGYRSYGQLIFPTSQLDAYQRIAGAQKENSLDVWDEQRTIDLKYTEPWHQSQYIKDNDSLTVLDYSGWKWYESYPDIQAIEDFMSYLDENQHLWLFWRKGEDLDDITLREGPTRSGSPEDVPFLLSEGYSELSSMQTLHGWETYSPEEQVYYYSLQIEPIPKFPVKKWDKQVKDLKKFMEDNLDLELTQWEDIAQYGASDRKPLLTTKIDTLNYNDRIYSNENDGNWVPKLRKYLDEEEIGGSDEAWHLFLTQKERHATTIDVQTIHGPHQPYDFDIYPQIDIGWDWSPRKAAPPKSINFRSIVV